MQYTLSLVINSSLDSVLMCNHRKFGCLNFVGGKFDDTKECWLKANYRELEEETGITPQDISLEFVRHEIIDSGAQGQWDMYITAGVLTKEVELHAEKNELFWIKFSDIKSLVEDSKGYGNCYTFLREACIVLGIDHDFSEYFTS